VTQLLTPAEAAARLGVARGTLYNWISDGKIAVVRLSGRCVRIRETEIDRLIRRSEQRAVA
jgi:excisionase family DNA binding protein